jgi:nitronate monooxygenase
LDLPDLPSQVSPFGVGFIVWTTPIEILDQVFPRDEVTPHPAAAWLFAGQFEDWIPVIRERSPETLIYVQVGELNVQPESHEPNSKEARRAVNAGVDVLVAQGSDCGGHGAANSASIISLVPEIVSTFPQIPVLAAGGIVDASGILAALVLGAEGVVMGTRFATTPESAMADNAKALILRTTDGGATTKRFYPT